MAVDPVDPEMRSFGRAASWVPTRKWLATTGLAVLTIVVMFVSEGSIDFTNGLEADEWALLGILAQRVLAYLVANKATAPMTGVPGTRDEKL